MHATAFAHSPCRALCSQVSRAAQASMVPCSAVASWLVDRRDACPPRPHCVHTACTGDRRLNRVCVLLRGRCSACAAVSQERDCVLPGIVYPYVQERATEEVRLAHYAPGKSRGVCSVVQLYRVSGVSAGCARTWA